MPRRVAIVGSRDFPHLFKVALFIRTLEPSAWVVSGGARGVDSFAKTYARQQGHVTLTFPARWRKFGKGAGYKRNSLIVDAADTIVAFWDGKSRGTLDTLCKAVEAHKKVHVFLL